jgi:hypothetical protein
MAKNNDPREHVTQDDARARKAAADSLRRQIESLKAGREPRTFNEFSERKAAEDRAREKGKK